MIRLLSACALLCAFFITPAEAKQRRVTACIETGSVMAPVCMGQSANFLAGVRSIRVTMRRERRALSRPVRGTGAASAIGLRYRAPDASFSLAKPARYVAGRLICAINVNSALAERGITGTGSAVAKSFLRWGRASAPVPGAVAVSSRRGGGHVAIVSRIEGGRIYVWNPSPRGRGWEDQAYRYRAISFRVPG